LPTHLAAILERKDPGPAKGSSKGFFASFRTLLRKNPYGVVIYRRGKSEIPYFTSSNSVFINQVEFGFMRKRGCIGLNQQKKNIYFHWFENG
jgi:hypothetical protein